MSEKVKSSMERRRKISLWGSYLVVSLIGGCICLSLLIALIYDNIIVKEIVDLGYLALIIWIVACFALLFCTPLMQVIGIIPAWKRPLSEERMKRPALVILMRIFLVTVYFINLYFIYFILFKFGPSWG